MKIAAILAALLPLAACTTAHEFVTSDGRPGLAITCNGTANGWEACYSKARDQCHGAYRVLDQGGDSWRVRNMNVECGTS